MSSTLFPDLISRFIAGKRPPSGVNAIEPVSAGRQYIPVGLPYRVSPALTGVARPG
ncbi:MAG: hypothetical protein ACQSGP_28450 [Frankia sp.]